MGLPRSARRRCCHTVVPAQAMASHSLLASCAILPVLHPYRSTAESGSVMVLGIRSTLVYCAMFLRSSCHVRSRRKGCNSCRHYTHPPHYIWLVPALSWRFWLAVQLDEPAHARAAVDGTVIIVAVACQCFRQLRRYDQRHAI